jgi:hypothetical protein
VYVLLSVSICLSVCLSLSLSLSLPLPFMYVLVKPSTCQLLHRLSLITENTVWGTTFSPKVYAFLSIYFHSLKDLNISFKEHEKDKECFKCIRTDQEHHDNSPLMVLFNMCQISY